MKIANKHQICYTKIKNKTVGDKMIDLNQVLTFSEAAEKWGLADGSAIRKAVERNKFQAGEIKKSGQVWLTTYPAMSRVFGEPKVSALKIDRRTFFQLITARDNTQEVSKQLEVLQQEVLQAFADHKKVMIVEKNKEKEHILYLFTHPEEFNFWISLHEKTAKHK